MMTEAISKYNPTKPDVKIDYQPQPGDYGAKWRAALAASQSPDMFVIHGTALWNWCSPNICCRSRLMY